MEWTEIMRLFGQNLTLAIISVGLGFGCGDAGSPNTDTTTETRMSALERLDVRTLTPPRMLTGDHAPDVLSLCDLTRNADTILMGQVAESKLDMDRKCEPGAIRGPKRVVDLQLEDGSTRSVTLLAHQAGHDDLKIGTNLVVGIRKYRDTNVGLGYFIVDQTRSKSAARLSTITPQEFQDATRAPHAGSCVHMTDADFHAYLTHKPACKTLNVLEDDDSSSVDDDDQPR